MRTHYGVEREAECGLLLDRGKVDCEISDRRAPVVAVLIRSFLSFLILQDGRCLLGEQRDKSCVTNALALMFPEL